MPRSTEELLARDAWLRQLAAAMVGEDSDAADLVQETWLRVLRARLVRPLRDPMAWLSTVLRNAARNLQRSGVRRRARELSAARPEADPAASPFDLAAYEECRERLVQAVELLPPAQRQVVVARYWEGLEPAAIARRLGEDPAAVRQRLSRALASLRARLERATPEGRCLGLAPLLLGRRAAVSASALAGSGSILLLAGLGMKKALAVAAGLLAVLLTTFVGLRWLGPAPSLPEPAPPLGPAGVAVHGESEPARARRVAMPDAEAGGRGAEHVLLDTAGVRQAGVRYWADERPYRKHPGRPPEAAPCTDAEGRFHPTSDQVGAGEFLWFEIDEGLCLAVERGTLGGSPIVRLPPQREVTVEIRSLPAGEPWRIMVLPAWMDGDRDMNHGDAHAALDPRAGARALWLVRRQMTRTGAADPARARFRLLEGWPAAFYCQARGYDVEPEVQELVDPELVVAHAAGARRVLPFEVVEPDAATPSGMGGWVHVHSASSGWSQDFANGRGVVGWGDTDDPAPRWLSIVLRDGELFRFRLDDERLGAGKTLRVVRGTGRGACLCIEDPGEVASWPGACLLLELDGEVKRTSLGAPLRIPFGDLAAWLHRGHLVVQTEHPPARLGVFFVVAADGRVARGLGQRLVPLPSVAMEPIEPRAIIERFAVPAGAASVHVRQEVELGPSHGQDPPRWIAVCFLNLHRVEGLGWRLSRTGSLDEHERLPDKVPAFAPQGDRSRLRVWLRGSADWIDLPHVPLLRGQRER